MEVPFIVSFFMVSIIIILIAATACYIIDTYYNAIYYKHWIDKIKEEKEYYNKEAIKIIEEGIEIIKEHNKNK